MKNHGPDVEKENEPMRDLAKSMLRFSWAASLYGAERVLSRLQPDDASPKAPPREPPKAPPREPMAQEPMAQETIFGDSSPLDALTWQTQDQLGQFFKAAFHAGDAAQQEWIDRIAESFSRTGLAGAVETMAKMPVDACRFASPDAAGAVTRQEFRNRLEVYRLVTSVRNWLDLPEPGTPFDLRATVDQALRLDRHRALWAVEGLGHAYGETALLRDEPPKGLLTDPSLQGLPLFSVAMLHAGIGLAFSQGLLAALTPASSAGEVRRTVERFVELCRDNTRQSVVFGSLEALGLIARSLYPELVPGLDRALIELADDTLTGYFWHGVGRAIYFAPIHFIPGFSSLVHAIEMTRDEASHPLALDNAMAGVGMACALVNMAHPSILETALRAYGDELEWRFFEGVVAAAVLRYDHSPDPTSLALFRRHMPRETESDLRRLWREKIQEPCEEALAAEDLEVRALPLSLRPEPGARAVPFTQCNAMIRRLSTADGVVDAHSVNGDSGE